MPTSFSTPGVHVSEGSAPPPILGAPIATAFLGWTPAGTLDAPIDVSTFAEFKTVCGGLSSAAAFGHSVGQFFTNGGTRARIVRIADPLAPDTPVLPGTEAFATLLPDALTRLDRIDFDVLCTPGETRPAVLAMLAAYCVGRRAFLIADAPLEATAATLAEGPPPELTGVNGRNSAWYWPWVFAPDPLAGGRSTAYPPSGFVAGVYARTDGTRGLWKAPAGVEATLIGSLALTQTITNDEQGPLNAQGVNVLRQHPSGRVVWGARTLDGQDGAMSEWKYVSVRRLVLHIERSLERGLNWAVFEPNDEPLWAQVRLTIGAFMHSLFRDGAFQGSSPRDAYFVRCDRTTVTQDDISRGVLECVIGFAPLKPAEFVVLTLRQTVATEAGPTRAPFATGHDDPYRAYPYRLRWAGATIAGFTQVSALRPDGIAAGTWSRQFERGVTFDGSYDRWLATGTAAAPIDLELQIADPSGAVVATEHLAACIPRSVQALPATDAATPALTIEALRIECLAGSPGAGQLLRPRARWIDLVLPPATLASLRELARTLAAGRTPGLPIVLRGASGTGKTLAAEAVASASRLNLYRVDLDAVVSKYIGETEKNLERAFREAARLDAALLIDEADALFERRTELGDASDRHAKEAVSWLLSPRWPPVFLETRGGSSVPTNVGFRFVDFEPPDRERRRELWRRHWPEWNRIDDATRARIADVALVGGAIHAAARDDVTTEGRPVDVNALLRRLQR